MSASDSEFVARNWRRENGLPDDSIQTLLQTRDGYLWIGTARGLARYDGVKFKVFDRTSTPEFKSDDINCLAEDAGGFLWVGTKSGLVGATTTAEAWTSPDETGITEHVRTLAASRSGGVWIGTAGALWRRTAGKTESYGRPGDGRTGPIECLSEDRNGMLWIGTHTGFWRLDLDRGGAHFRPVDLPAAAGLFVQAIQPTQGGGFWVLINDSGMRTRLYRYEQGQWEQYGDDMDPHPDRAFLASTRTGELWFSVHHASVRCLRGTQLTVHNLLPDEAMVTPQCAYGDREGNIWIGTMYAGLFCWRPRRITSFTRTDGLPSDCVWTVYQTPRDGVLIGTDRGLSRVQPGKIVNLTVKEGLPNKVVRALAADRSERLWIGTLAGLACLVEGRLIRYEFPGPWFSSKVRAILVDRQDRLWVGSANGLHRVALSNLGSGGDTSRRMIDAENLVTYRTDEGLLDNDVSALLEDRAGRIWIGTSGGLNRMSGDRLERFSSLPYLANGNVGTLFEDEEGDIWIGAESGLHCYRDGTFNTFTTKDGLFDDLINSILDDGRGHLWFGGDRGIYRVRKTELHAVCTGRASRLWPITYDDADGLLSPETNGQKCQPSASRTRDGRLWFATTKGVAVFDPEHLPDNTNAPLVVIEEIRVDGRVVRPEDSRAGLAAPDFRIGKTDALAAAKAGDPSAVIQFPPGAADVLEIHYTASTFVAPERVRFKYRLEGQDEDWVQADTRRAAYYTNLRPGNYRFHVTAANGYGAAQEKGASIGFQLAPHFYQTLPFRLGCGLGAALLMVGFYRWRLTELRRHQTLQQQAALVAERARIAKNLHDGLGANLTQLTLLADLMEQDQPETVRDRIRNLAVTSRETAREFKDLLWATHPADESVEGLMTRICQHAEEFLGTADVRCRFDLPAQWPPLVLTPAARQSLFLAAKEIFNNIAKHAQATEVFIRAHWDEETLVLEIEDNGRGFFPDQVLRTARPRGAGIDGRGLRNLRSRAEEFGGLLVVDSRPGQGTTVRFSISLTAIQA